MYRIAHVYELKQITDMPVEVVEAVNSIVTILDREYGAERDPLKSDGGYVVILTLQDDISALKDIGLDAERLCPEQTDIIETASGGMYINSLVLFNNEFAINIIMENNGNVPRNLLADV